jgi:ribosome-associated protein
VRCGSRQNSAGPQNRPRMMPPHSGPDISDTSWWPDSETTMSDEPNDSHDTEDAQGMAQPETAAARRPELYETSMANACAAAKIADDLRGQDVVVLDLTHVTSIVDFFVIATGNSRRQMHAIADEVNRKLKREDGNQRVSIEGYRTEGNWILTDYGDVVLHVFTSEGRTLYNLEGLWADAKKIDWHGLLNRSDADVDEAGP